MDSISLYIFPVTTWYSDFSGMTAIINKPHSKCHGLARGQDRLVSSLLKNIFLGLCPRHFFLQPQPTFPPTNRKTTKKRLFLLTKTFNYADGGGRTDLNQRNSPLSNITIIV
jgi:hypothetical protein